MKKLLLLLFIPFFCFGQFSNVDLSSEESIINYFEKKGTDELEGIWKVIGSYKNQGDPPQSIEGRDLSLAIVKNNDFYDAYVILSTNNFFTIYYDDYGDDLKYKEQVNKLLSNGVLYFRLKKTINQNLFNVERIRFSCKWDYDKSECGDLFIDESYTKNSFCTVESYNLIEMDSNGGFPFKLIKTFENRIQRKSNSNEWIGNGSGIVISKFGHIVTNNHVVEDTEDIEIDMLVNGEIQKFNAEVVQKDLRNDLAILKIVDVNFDNFDHINYNFKTRSSDVGTKIYTFGYPKALSGMGKEMKVTEGIISSKSGIMGDITTYQITAPIQGGNSGGPLFDAKGNLIGINSSKFNSDETENVNYSIKSSYVLNLIDVLPKSIDLPSSTKLQSLPLTEQIKEISKYVVLVKVK
jgi:S1-C subfamily serine protease